MASATAFSSARDVAKMSIAGSWEGLYRVGVTTADTAVARTVPSIGPYISFRSFLTRSDSISRG